jgi:hypothetical protein
MWRKTLAFLLGTRDLRGFVEGMLTHASTWRRYRDFDDNFG